MAKLRGPLMSLDARGSLGDSLTFARIGNTNFARHRAKPSNPQTLAQQITRARGRYLNALWQLLNATYRATWQPIADERAFTLINALQATNLKRLSDGLWPISSPTLTPGSSSNWIDEVTFEDLSAAGAWGYFGIAPDADPTDARHLLLEPYDGSNPTSPRQILWSLTNSNEPYAEWHLPPIPPGDYGVMAVLTRANGLVPTQFQGFGSITFT